MQDIDDFDPLDDILLSDDEPPRQTVAPKNPTIFHKTEDIDFDYDFRKKKKKMLADLFGSEETKKVETQPSTSTAAPSQSDWLDLKNDSPERTLPPNPTNPTNTTGFEKEPQRNSILSTPSIVDRRPSTAVPEVSERTVHFVDNSSTSSRRISDSSPALMRKSKPRFKSLDLNLDLEFDSASQDEVLKPQNTLVEDVLGQSSYKPSVGLNRRISSSKARISFLDTRPSSSVHRLSSQENNTLPAWLEPKAEIKPVAVISKLNESRTTSSALPSDKDTIDDNKTVEKKIPDHVKDDEPSNFVTVVSELMKKQENLKQTAKNQVQVLSAQEQEIRNAALELMKQQRNSVKALIQILSGDNVLHESGEESSVSRAALESTLTQLQTRQIQTDLEKAELEMQLKHAERKHKIDLTMMEDLCRYKLKIFEERESHLEGEIISLHDEFNSKLQKQKETEEELVRTYNEKLRILQEEHLGEMKRVAELQNLKASIGLTNKDKKNVEEIVSKELTLREIAIEEKQKELMEFEERLNRIKISLENKKASIDTRIEEFETKIAKEKLSVEQQKKDVKLSQDIFAEKEKYWEREKQREKDFISSCKQELETLKENLLVEERKLMKEQFEISAERARLEAVINSEGSTGQISDVIQARAELQGTIEEVRHLKSRLETERNEIKKEEMRLKEEKWRLRNIEQEFSFQQKHVEKLFQEAELKKEEGVRALKRAQSIERHLDERVENVEKRMMELNRKEELLTKEKIELSKERDLLSKKKYQLDMILPQLSYEEQLPYKILNKNLVDPRIMIMKLKAENDLSPII